MKGKFYMTNSINTHSSSFNDIFEIMTKRHSVRQYTSSPIEPAKRAIIDEMVAQINSEQGHNIQTFYDEPQCFDSMLAHYGKLSGVKNYIALIGAKSHSHSLDESLGYWGEHIVLKLQEMGLNSCWVMLTHGKCPAKVFPGEKLVCLISFGYGTTQGASHKSKPLNKVCNFSQDVPDWFIKGVKAALLAPTAMNQQKFYFQLLPDNTVKASFGMGFGSKIDFGIAKYHFEAATGKKVLP